MRAFLALVTAGLLMAACSSGESPTSAPVGGTPTEAPVESVAPDDDTDPCIESTGGDAQTLLDSLAAGLLQENVDGKYKKFAAATKAAKKPAYKTFFRNAESYQNKPVYFKGEVIQAMYDEPWGGADCASLSALLDGDATILRVNVTKGSYDIYRDTVYVVYLGTKRVLEGDIIEFVGIGNGLVTYEATSGAAITIPTVVVGKYLFIR